MIVINSLGLCDKGNIAHKEQRRCERLSRRLGALAEGPLVQRVWKKIRT
jgi:hypothetical protein